MDAETYKRAAAARALDYVRPGMRLGLGTGSTAKHFVDLLGERVRAGLDVVAVPTSEATHKQALGCGIRLTTLDETPELDLTVDGADEVAPNLDLVKGWGGALVHERIVAAASARQVILVGAEKLVRALGERGRVPVEVVPLAEWLAVRECEALGLAAVRRSEANGARPFITENGNIILDCVLPEPVGDPVAARELHRCLRAIAGVVDTGLFLGTASEVLVGHPGGRVEMLERAPARKEPA
jgi:ribose 5-phosphate isomerase A